MTPSPAASALDVVRAIYAGVAANDQAALGSLIDPGIVVHQAKALPFGGRWEGLDGFAAMAARLYAAWPDFEVEPVAFFADGDVVLVETRVRARLDAPRPLDQPMIERWRITAGRAVECRPFYFDAAAAAASAA